MLEPDSLIYLSERTIRINANSILDHTNGRTKKVDKQFFFFFHENGTEKISLPFTSFKSLQTADEENRREEFKTTGLLNCSRKNNGTEKGNAQSSFWDM